MEEQLLKLYSTLVNQIVTMIPVEWSEIYYLGEVAKNKKSWSSIFYYKDNDSFIRSYSIPDVYDVSIKMYDDWHDKLNGILLELYSCFSDYEQELWEQIYLFIDNKGGFKINFRYDVMKDDDGGQLTREIIWAHETFGFIPENTYFKKVLNQYLESKKLEN